MASIDAICSCFLATLPPYSPSTRSPAYTLEPTSGERILQHSLPSGGFRQRNPESLFTKKLADSTVVLRGQECDVQTPWYGRDEIATGYIVFDDPSRITEVSLLVEGKLDLNLAEGVSKVITVLDSSTTLWKKSCMEKSCPGQVEFVFTLPRTYESAHATHPLPPSFHVTDSSDAPMFVGCTYHMRFSITKAPKNRFNWETTDHVLFPFDYIPRTRTQDPVLRIPGCLANIKELPNEWYQASVAVPIESHPCLEPVTTNLFVPSARVYPISEPIPFHVQINGRVESLRALLSSSESDGGLTLTNSPSNNLSHPRKRRFFLPTTAVSGLLSKPKSTPQPLAKCENETLRVYIIRQIRAQVNSKSQVKNLIIAEGALESVPPMISDCYCYPMGDSELEYFSWAGSLKVNADVKTGGFEGEYVKVHDFVALVIGRSEAPWADVRSSVGIKLVTDAWEDPAEDIQDFGI